MADDLQAVDTQLRALPARDLRQVAVHASRRAPKPFREALAAHDQRRSKKKKQSKKKEPKKRPKRQAQKDATPEQQKKKPRPSVEEEKVKVKQEEKAPEVAARPAPSSPRPAGRARRAPVTPEGDADRELLTRLQSENKELQRRLDRYEGSSAIDVTQDGDDDDAQHRDTGLRDLRDQKARALLVAVKRERNDAWKKEVRFVKVKRERDDAVTRVECVVCMDRPRAVLFLPCNHLVVCASCATATAACPYCSGAVQSQITVANES
jgi:hypothetical protein